MGWFGRLKLIWHTEMYDALDALEDPKKGMDYSLVRLEEHLAQAQQSLVDITTAQHLLGNRRGQAAAAACTRRTRPGPHWPAFSKTWLEALGRRQTALAHEPTWKPRELTWPARPDALRVTLAALQTHVELLRSKKEEG